MKHSDREDLIEVAVHRPPSYIRFFPLFGIVNSPAEQSIQWFDSDGKGYKNSERIEIGLVLLLSASADPGDPESRLITTFHRPTLSYFTTLPG